MLGLMKGQRSGISLMGSRTLPWTLQRTLLLLLQPSVLTSHAVLHFSKILSASPALSLILSPCRYRKLRLGRRKGIPELRLKVGGMLLPLNVRTDSALGRTTRSCFLETECTYVISETRRRGTMLEMGV